jgi:hypothetical protein
MSININQAINNFVKDISLVRHNIDERNLEVRQATLIARVVGVASLALGAVAAFSAISSLSIPLMVASALLLVGGHDLVKIGDNVSDEIDPRINLSALRTSCNSAINGEPSVFHGTLIPFSAYESVFTFITS